MRRVADRTGCKRIEADTARRFTLSVRPAGKGKNGPPRLVQTHAQTSMASSVAARLVDARALSQNEKMRIGIRAQRRMLRSPS
eukprot:4818600-Pleurochrysis_carterae.AAC.1